MTDRSGPSRPRRLLDAVASVCMLIVVVQILWAGALIGQARWKEKERRMEYRARSQVHRGTLLSNPSAVALDNGAISRLGTLAPVASLGPDSVRLAANPSLTDYAYALALRRRTSVAEGVVVVFARGADGTESRTSYRFEAPANEYGIAMSQFDTITDSYAGGDRLCTDGVEYAFERRRGPLTTSGTSMSTCDPTYEKGADLQMRKEQTC